MHVHHCASAIKITRTTTTRAANSSVPSTPVIDANKKAPSFTQEQPHLDAYERALRQRKQEVSDEQIEKIIPSLELGV